MQRHRVYGLVGLLVAIALPLTWWGRQQLAQRVISPAASDRLPATDPMRPNALSTPVTSADEAAISTVIQQQLEAFQTDNAELAFSFASPGIQAQFQTADQFVAMVQAIYKPVYRPQSVDFGSLKVIRGQPVQAVTVLGPDGTWMTAYYQMERQADRTWRIAGCMLVPIAGTTI